MITKQINKPSNATRLIRLQEQMQQYAHEPVTVEKIVSSYYVYGSELATLRIFRKYKGCDNVDQGYSENLKTFYFVIKY